MAPWLWLIASVFSGDLDRALEASGLSGHEKARAAASLQPALSAVAKAATVVEAAPGAAVLEALHERLLSGYDEGASTIADVLEGGRFNCVSATVLYLIAARAAGLEVRAELLPTHARARVREGGRWVVVETTSPRGYGPDPATIARVAEQVVPVVEGKRALVPPQGRTGGLEVALAAMYSNRAVAARLRGEDEEAERMLAGAEGLVPDQAMAAALRTQRAAALARIAQPGLDSETEPALIKAQDALLQAVALSAEDGALAATLAHNLRVATERRVAMRLAAGDIEGAEATSREAQAVLPDRERTGLSVATASRVAVHRFEAGEQEAAVAALEAASRVRLDPSDRALADAVRHNLRAARLAAAAGAAESGHLTAALAWLPAASGTDIEAVAIRAGLVRLESGDLDGALSAFERCLERVPESAPCAHNRRVALERLLVRAMESKDCAAVEAAAAARSRVAPPHPGAAQAALACWLETARARLGAEDPEGAVRALDRVAARDRGQRAYRSARRSAVTSWVIVLAESGRCKEARRVGAELKAREVETALRGCPG